MTIHLPENLETSLREAVHGGEFPSMDEAIAQAVRLLLKNRSEHKQTPAPGMGLIGALRDDAELLDQAVEHAMKVREERPWRLNSGE